MKGMLIKVSLALVLFAGSVVGGLAATGRWNAEGLANVPLLKQLYPLPEADPHSVVAPPPVLDVAPPKAGRSIHDADQKPAADPHGAPAPAGETAAPHGAGHDAAAEGDPFLSKLNGQEPAKEAHAEQPHAARTDFDAMELALAQDRLNKYAPGKLFRFDGLPAGLSPEEINAAWQRVAAAMTELERRTTALDLREQEMQDLAADVARRQRDLASERSAIESRHAELDRRIARFEQDIVLVRADETAALKKNAQTYDALERDKVAAMLQEAWKTEAAQNGFLKIMEFMDQEVVNEVLGLLPNPLVQDVLDKRTRVTKAAQSSATSR